MMTIPQIQLLMLSSKTLTEWSNNVDKVKKEFNGYPEWKLTKFGSKKKTKFNKIS